MIKFKSTEKVRVIIVCEVRKSNPHQRIKAVPVLKGAEFLIGDIEKLGGNISTIDFLFDYHFGGYAKSNSALHHFCKTFFTETKIPIEPVYTGKMLLGLYNLIKQNRFEPGTRIVALHTGGLQGINGYAEYFGDGWYQPSQ